MKTLNDKLMLQDILAHLRDLMNACNMGIQHSNCPNMRANVTKANARTTESQFAVFKYMNENQMYPIKNATDAELLESVKMHKTAAENCKV